MTLARLRFGPAAAALVCAIGGWIAAGCGAGTASEPLAPSAASAAQPSGTPAAATFRLEPPAVAAWLPDPAARHGDGMSMPIPHHDGDRALVVGRDGGRFVAYEQAIAGSGHEVIVRHGGDVGRAAYLPDGPIVFSGTVTGTSPLAGVGKAWALFVLDPTSGTTRRITFGAGLDADPYVLADGRIVFASWRPGAGRLGLFTVHPDGTGYAPFHLRDDAHLVLPVQDVDSLDVFAWAVTDGGSAERIRIDWDAPLSHAEPDDASAVTLAPRRRPQGHLSSMKEDQPWGTLVCVDARANGAGDATRVRVGVWSPRASPATADDGTLGEITLADDGSFMAKVPADTPLRMTLVRADGSVAVREHGPFWVRNNEVRVCVSCHDDVETGPPNQRPAAVLEAPVDLTEGVR